MNLIERAVVGLCRVLLWISTAVIFVILVANTVLRYATGSSLQWANELPELLFPWLVMSGVVLAAAHGAHITTSFLMDAVPAALRRWFAGLADGAAQPAVAVMFVSPNAAQCFVDALAPGWQWPAAVLAAATGPGTTAVLRAAA